MNRKQEVQVSLVRKAGEDGYRVVTDRDLMLLKVSGRLIPEKNRVDTSRVGKNYFYSYYVQA